MSRAGFYRSLQEQEPMEEDMEVRSAIQKIVAEDKRRYGYRRVSAELRRRGMMVNHKHVARLMREDNLLAVQPKAFIVTTDSAHDREVNLNLAGRMKLTGINQLWVADITYPAAWRVGVSGGGDGWVPAQSGRLGAGPNIDLTAADGGAGESDSGSQATAGRGAPFQSRRSVRFRRLRRSAAKTRHPFRA